MFRNPRVVSSCVHRAAARCNKGFDVLYITGVEHFVQVAVRVRRGAQQADRSVAHLGTILHCSLCQQWRVKTPTLSVTGTPVLTIVTNFVTSVDINSLHLLICIKFLLIVGFSVYLFCVVLLLPS
jgi:tRNA G26 N,N-dimethylase Trm1